tara:strand:- start:968 stop:1210 length:243 start_codon:yes stop_codon:yes gene_type:complete
MDSLEKNINDLCAKCDSSFILINNYTSEGDCEISMFVNANEDELVVMMSEIIREDIIIERAMRTAIILRDQEKLGKQELN